MVLYNRGGIVPCARFRAPYLHSRWFWHRGSHFLRSLKRRRPEMPPRRPPHTRVRTPPANATSPSQRNTVLTDSGDVRASKLIGSAVYNDRDEKIGSVDDLVLGKDNKADDVIVSVGGFLGMGTKLVSVPYTQLRLGDTKNASSSNKVVMPGATKESLKGQPEFHYTNRG